MTRASAFIFALIATTMSIFAANELPTNDNEDLFEIEPPLLIPNRDAEKSSAANSTATPAPIVDPDKLEKDLERAKRNAAGSERLFKIGAIAKVEAEQRALRVVRLQSQLENARLTLAKEELAQQQTRATAGEVSRADLTNAETAMTHAIEDAHAATTKRERAELDAAESNLHRQQKLLALGSGRTSDVNRAEQKLAELKSAKE